MSKESFARGFAKKASEHGIDPESLAKIATGNEPSLLDNLAAGYAQLSDGARMAINTGVPALAGAGIGALFGKKKKKLRSAIIGALAGGATGAVASKTVNAPDWLKLMAARGTRGKLTGNQGADNEVGKNLLRWISSNENGPLKDLLNKAVDEIGKPVKFRLPWWAEGEYVETPPTRFDLDSLIDALSAKNK